MLPRIQPIFPICASLYRTNTYFKILTLSEWQNFQRNLVFKGTEKDIKNGSICLCRDRDQCQKMIYQEKEYKNSDIYILSLNFKRRVLINTERDLDGQRYPRLYEFLRYEDISTIEHLYVE